MTKTEKIIYQVYFWDNKWNIRNQNSTNIIESFINKEDAINYAVSIARRNKANVDVLFKDFKKLESYLFYPDYCARTHKELDYVYLIIKDFGGGVKIYDDTRKFLYHQSKAFTLDSDLVYLYENSYSDPEGDGNGYWVFRKCSCLGKLHGVYSNIKEATDEYAKLKYSKENRI